VPGWDGTMLYVIKDPQTPFEIDGEVLSNKNNYFVLEFML
jgi:hypothetical protein